MGDTVHMLKVTGYNGQCLPELFCVVYKQVPILDSNIWDPSEHQ